MSNDENANKIIEEYNTKQQYYDGLRDDINNLQRAVADMKANIKNTQQLQDKMKQQNYEIWSNLEVKDITPKTTEKPQVTIADILESFK